MLYSAYDTDLWHALLNGEDCDLELQKRPGQVMLHGGKTCKKIIQMSQFPHIVGLSTWLAVVDSLMCKNC